MTFEILTTDFSRQSLQHWSDVEKNETCGYNLNSNNPQRSDFSEELLRYFFRELKR